tara:strand:- start:1840 stop:2139 length:300 start_codon:yes stop_codon:yes gene_type:complete
MIITPNTNKPERSVREWVADQNQDAIMINGYDHCIIGISQDGRILYSVDDILRTLVGAEHSWNFEDAIEWFEFNIQGAFCDKKNHPKFISTSFSDSYLD